MSLRFDRSLLDAPRDRERRMSAEALGMPLGALLEVRVLAQPHPFAVIRLDAPHRLAFNVEGAHVCRARLNLHASSMPRVRPSG